jgi:DNA polymerase
MRATIKTGQACTVRHVSFRKEGPILRLKLPSGRELSYVKPAIVNDQITYEGTHQASGAWGRIESYGPKIVENIVQATARDCLAVAIKRLELMRIPVVFHVHDEVICEVPCGERTPEEIATIISHPIPWAERLPLRAEAYECA